MLLITNRGARKGYVQLWLCLLSRTRGRKSGRGSQGKRRWREWWTPIHCIGEALAWEDAETVHHDMMGRMRSLNVRTQWESKLPDNVHILWDDAVDAAAQTA